MRMRTLVSGLLVGAATIAPVVTVTAPAEAATLSTWNRLAMCESSGRWHINTGNGYYGGLQISPSTWRAFHGRQYAVLPHRATKGEQIRVAERIKRHQGWRAWPSCTSRLGLR